MSANTTDQSQFNEIINKDDIFIAVMGLTGCGKSTMISECSGQEVPVGHTLDSCTSKLAMYSFDHKDRKGQPRRVHLIDTPGFDDSARSDVEILQEVVFWLSQAYDNGFFLDGIVYLHNITMPRFDDHSKRSLAILKALVGSRNYKCVYLAATFWKEAHALGDSMLQRAYRNYQQLIDSYWKELIDEGAPHMPAPDPSIIIDADSNTVNSVAPGSEFAWTRSMLDHFVNKGSKHVLQIQSEMRLPEAQLSQTTAAQLAGELWHLDDTRRNQIPQLNSSKQQLTQKWSTIVETDMQLMQKQISDLRLEISRLESAPPKMTSGGGGQYFDTGADFQKILESPEEVMKRQLKEKEAELEKIEAKKLQKRGFRVNVLNTSMGTASAVLAAVSLASTSCEVM